MRLELIVCSTFSMRRRSKWISQQSPRCSCTSTPILYDHRPNSFFSKPNTALGDPWPAPTLLPKITQNDGSGDYESELAIVIGKAAKNVSEENAMDYVLGFTAANDVSSRVSQLNQSQWCFSKGFDGACPIGNVCCLSVAIKS